MIIQPKYSFVSIIGLLYNYANIAETQWLKTHKKSHFETLRPKQPNFLFEFSRQKLIF